MTTVVCNRLQDIGVKIQRYLLMTPDYKAQATSHAWQHYLKQDSYRKGWNNHQHLPSAAFTELQYCCCFYMDLRAGHYTMGRSSCIFLGNILLSFLFKRWRNTNAFFWASFCDRVTNEKLCQDLESVLAKTKFHLVGHIFRMDNDCAPWQI